MKYAFIIIILFLFSTLNTKATSLTTSQNRSKPIVKADSSYTIIIKKNIEYAKGLRHASINSNIAQPISLLLDAYIPNNTVKNRPAMVLIHGGGFAGGSKEHKQIVKMARYFASRGWVVFSINYRLKKHKGTIPDSWQDYGKQNFENQKSNTFFSLYPANRDAKAAIRWVYANAKSYKINTNFITVGGGSAGAV